MRTTPSGTSASTPTDWRWATAWAGWIAYFAVVENAAIRSRNPKAPLSYFLRHALGIPHSQWHRRAGQIVAGGAFVWLVQHLTAIEKKEG